MKLFVGKKDPELANIKNHIKSACDLLSCLRHCGEHHTSYKIYYSDCSIIDCIIKSKSIILRNNKYNDKIDENNIKDTSDGFLKFVICFTFSISENVAMWIVYSKKENGKFVKGAMIPFSKEMLKSIVDNNSKIEYGNFDGIKFNYKGETTDFSIEMCDVIYYSKRKEDSNNYDIKKGDTKTECNIKTIDSLTYVKKYYPWNYENECRMIVKINKDLIENGVNSVKLKLTDDVIKDIKNKCVSSPLCENDSEFKDSSLKGQLNF